MRVNGLPRRIGARGLWTVLGMMAGLLSPFPSCAHPMGNFSISHYAGIHVERDFIELNYLIDMAEIPTFQEMQQSGIAAQPDDPRVKKYVRAMAVAFAQHLTLTLNGRALPLQVISEDVIFPQGAGNLPTMKFGFVYRAAMAGACDSERCELTYRDTNFPGRAGWKEVVASPGVGILFASSSAPAQDRSDLLANYPTDLLNSPPQDLEARIHFSEGAQAMQGPGAKQKPQAPVRAISKPQKSASPAVASRIAPSTPTSQEHAPSLQHSPISAGKAPSLQLQPNRQATPRNPFTELMHVQQIGVGMVLLAAVIAACLGALHALEPGHGKTIVAAYLIGSKGTARHAFLLGMIVTVSHTGGVYLLGAVTLYAQKYVLPERLYPFLGVLSGILIAGMGFYLFLQRFVGGEFSHSHSHGPNGHHHSHGAFSHTHPGEHAHEHSPDVPDLKDRVSARKLWLLGITGGIVPCPAALVVLLSAVAVHRVGFGLFLILAFSTGLAAVLIAMGLLAVYAGRMMSRLPSEGPLIQRWLPLTSAAIITMVGCVIAVRGLTAAGILHIRV